MIDGIWWLVILLTVVVALWILAKARGSKDEDANQGFRANKSDTKSSINKTSLSKNPLSKKSMSKQTVSKQTSSNKNTAKTPTSLWTKLFPNDALQKTAALLKESFPEYQVARKGQHLLISQQGIKVAMITVDKKIAVGQRLLGGIPVINYHRVPSRAQLIDNLK
ncbi:hypothetical protein [Psychrobacter sp. 16-MNA-CIBAN-0192]|uniref:hypothetical protein n=1 Tax=Psychrobacter sp. 16-MNA-CIBAN-0192 TaxID=3140448 RepID=UPI00332F4F48